MASRGLVAVVAYLVVAALMFIPLPSSPAAAPPGGHLDKLVHLVCWAWLGYATWWAVRGSAMRRWAIAVALGALFGVAVELLQGLTPHRGADPWDALADLLGAMLGAAVAIFAARSQPRRGTPHERASSR